MKSMTGFGYAEVTKGVYQAGIEIKSYNNRFLDINLGLPPGLSILETEIRDFCRNRITRGRVEVFVRLRETQSSVTAELDEELAKTYIQKLNELRRIAGIRKPLAVGDLAGVEGMIRIEKPRDADAFRPAVFAALEEAFDRFEHARIAEGEATVADIRRQLSRITAGMDAVEAQAGLIETTIVETLRQKFNEVIGSPLDETRVLTEAAALIVKHSINEEIARIRSHLAHFEETLDLKEPAGKKLDFVSQELNREINTIGSKSFMIAVTKEVVLLKDALENIREQLRNLE